MIYKGKLYPMGTTFLGPRTKDPKGPTGKGSDWRRVLLSDWQRVLIPL